MASGTDAGRYVTTVTATLVRTRETLGAVSEPPAYILATESATGELALTIKPAEVTVTAENKEKTVGDKDPELTWKVEGLQGSDKATVLKVTISRKAGEEVGKYTITPSGEKDQGNYVVKYVEGTLTIKAEGDKPGPKTGDGASLALWSALAMSSLVSLAGVWALGRKKFFRV